MILFVAGTCVAIVNMSPLYRQAVVLRLLITYVLLGLDVPFVPIYSILLVL
jgi:hypothetical protein